MEHFTELVPSKSRKSPFTQVYHKLRQLGPSSFSSIFLLRFSLLSSHDIHYLLGPSLLKGFDPPSYATNGIYLLSWLKVVSQYTNSGLSGGPQEGKPVTRYTWNL